MKYYLQLVLLAFVCALVQANPVESYAEEIDSYRSIEKILDVIAELDIPADKILDTLKEMDIPDDLVFRVNTINLF